MLRTQSETLSENSIELSIVLPAYAEENNLRFLLPLVIKNLKTISQKYEILVIDTSEPMDATQSVCMENSVRWIQRKGGNRYGDAVRTAIQEIKGKYAIFMDADGSHNPNFIQSLWNNRENAKIVIASRYIHGGNTDNPWLLVALSRLLNLACKWAINLPIYDLSNSYRLYHTWMLKEISLESNNYDILEELLAKIIWFNKLSSEDILELPFNFERRFSGKSKRSLILFGLHYLHIIYRLRKLKRLRIGN